MTKPLLTILFAFIYLNCFSQTYISLAPAIYNTTGTLAEKTTLDLEIGRQWDVFSLGLDIGKINLGKVNGRDTAWYTELRPNLNIFQQGKFTNTLTAGIGYIFNAKQNLLTEFTTGIEFTPNTKTSYNIYFGQYYFSGKEAASTVTFFGVSAMFYFAQLKTKGILNPPAK